MKVLILAGGYATRLWPLTEKRAKPLLLLDGKTILAHIIDKIPRDFEISILTNKKFEDDFNTEIKKIQRKHVQVFCEDSFSDGQKLGALGAISMFLKETNVEENLFVFAGDNILPALEVPHLICTEDTAHIAVRDVNSLYEARKFGVVEVGSNNRVKTFEEKPEKPKSTTVMTGFLSLGKNILPILHEYAQTCPDALGGIFVELLRRQKEIIAHKVRGDWFDVGSFETYLEAHKKLQKEDFKKGHRVQKEHNIFQGKVYIGDDCSIQSCRITDSILYPGCVLENCHISNSIIDESCHLSGLDLNQKLIRKGTSLLNES